MWVPAVGTTPVLVVRLPMGGEPHHAKTKLRNEPHDVSGACSTPKRFSLVGGLPDMQRGVSNLRVVHDQN